MIIWCQRAPLPTAVNALCLPELMNWLVDGGMLIATVHQHVWSQGLFDQTIERTQRDGLLKSVDREKAPCSPQIKRAQVGI